MIKFFLQHKFFLQAAIISSCLLLWGCENDDAAISEWTQKVVLTEEAKKVQAYLSQGGHLRARLLRRAVDIDRDLHARPILKLSRPIIAARTGAVSLLIGKPSISMC